MKRLRRLVKATDSEPGLADDVAKAADEQTDGASDGGAQRSSATSDATEASQVQSAGSGPELGNTGKGCRAKQCHFSTRGAAQRSSVRLG